MLFNDYRNKIFKFTLFLPFSKWLNIIHYNFVNKCKYVANTYNKNVYTSDVLIQDSLPYRTDIYI